jgi:hypothetical protein
MMTNNSFSDYIHKALTFYLIFGICMIILYCKIFEFIIIRTSIKKNIVNENLNNETYINEEIINEKCKELGWLDE